MFDPLLEDDPFWEKIAAWWRALTTLEKFVSVAVVIVFVTSGLTWPAMLAVGYRALGWLGLVCVTASFMAAGLPAFKVLGLLTGADDIRWMNLLWWEVLSLIALANALFAISMILAAI